MRGTFRVVEKLRVLEPRKVGATMGVGVSEREKEIPRKGCHVWSLRGGANVMPREGCHVRCVLDEGRKLEINQ